MSLELFYLIAMEDEPPEVWIDCAGQQIRRKRTFLGPETDRHLVDLELRYVTLCQDPHMFLDS